MSTPAVTDRYARLRRDGEEQRATALELFYDLVFVFAVTQVSHLLLAHLTWAGAAQSLLVLLVVWWAWNYTAWATNELDPDSPVVRGVLMTLTLLSLLMAVAIPGAFGGRGLLFAGCYVAIQVGRTLFLTFAAARRGSVERERAGRILIWFVASGVLWIAGGIADEPARDALWVAALALDYAAPLTVYWLPGRGRFDSTAWALETAHFAERFQLFVIIALGESIVVTGATTSELDLGLARIAALGVAFLVTAALWWLYFDYAARIAERRLALAADRTLLARDGYTYLHAVMIAGVIVSAVGDEIVIAHPSGRLGAPQAAAVVAGPAIYLLGLALFRLRLAGSVARKRLGGALACAAAGAAAALAPALAVASLVLAILVAVIASEHVAGARRAARGEPAPLERLEAAAAQREAGR